MTENLYNPKGGSESGHEADETLRLLAALPPPFELTDRVHQRLSVERLTPVRRGFWSLWMPAQRIQFAAAAVLVVAVAGSTWSIYHSHPHTGAQTGNGATAVPPVARATQGSAAGGFGTAGAVRVPPTLNPIQVPSVPKKKPGAGHRSNKPSPKRLAAPSSGADQAAKPNP
jgi:hypothetical protein